jgi:hypothetical protein
MEIYGIVYLQPFNNFYQITAAGFVPAVVFF